MNLLKTTTLALLLALASPLTHAAPEETDTPQSSRPQSPIGEQDRSAKYSEEIKRIIKQGLGARRTEIQIETLLKGQNVTVVPGQLCPHIIRNDVNGILRAVGLLREEQPEEQHSFSAGSGQAYSKAQKAIEELAEAKNHLEATIGNARKRYQETNMENTTLKNQNMALSQ